MKKEENFLDYIPVKNIEWAQDDEGRVFLTKERTKNKLLRKMIDWFNRSQVIYIHLDEQGTAAWLAIDGQRTVEKICRVMEEQFGEKMVQPEERLSFFMGMLKRNNFIDFI